MGHDLRDFGLTQARRTRGREIGIVHTTACLSDPAREAQGRGSCPRAAGQVIDRVDAHHHAERAAFRGER